jgi:hypothetical protein
MAREPNPTIMAASLGTVEQCSCGAAEDCHKETRSMRTPILEKQGIHNREYITGNI